MGKKANLALLDQDLFKADSEKISETKILATMFDSKLTNRDELNVSAKRLIL